MAKVTLTEKYTLTMDAKEAQALDALLANVSYDSPLASESSQLLSDIQDELREAFGYVDGYVFDRGPVFDETTGVVITGNPIEA